MVWFDEAIPLFQAVKFDGTTLHAREFFEAAFNCAKIYEYVWGGGMICRQLEKDLKGSAGPCLAAAQLDPTGFATVKQCPKEKMMGVEGFKKGLDVRHKMLWCTRALRFIVCILGKLVSDMKLEVHIAAKATYNEVLAPHHSWPVRQVARTALSQCPWRRDMLAKLKMTNPEFAAAATQLLGVMTPMVSHVNNVLMEFGLEKAGTTVATLKLTKRVTSHQQGSDATSSAATTHTPVEETVASTEDEAVAAKTANEVVGVDAAVPAAVAVNAE